MKKRVKKRDFCYFEKEENLKENKNIKTSDRNRNVSSRGILGQKEKGDEACMC